MMMPPQTNSRATITVTGLVPAPSPSSSALSSTPKTGFINPKTETRLTGLTASRRDHSEYAMAEMSAI